MNEEAWGRVGAPMLLDNGGHAVFIYTPPSIHSRSRSKAFDPRHAAKLFKRAAADKTGRWKTFHFSSHDTPHIALTALAEITGDMTNLAYRQLIMAEDTDEAPGALWHRRDIDSSRVESAPELAVVAVGIAPAISSNRASNETGIVVAGRDNRRPAHYYILADATIDAAKPDQWARRAIAAYHGHSADRVVPEVNQGGEMVAHTLRTIEPDLPITPVHASRGKRTRAEPIAALYEQGRVHHVGNFSLLEDQMCEWEPGQDSPDRMDALVWVLTYLRRGESTGKGQSDFSGLGVF